MNAFSPITPTRPFRMDAQMFSEMIGAGLFARHPNVELRDGELIEMAPQGNLHSRAKTELGFALMHAVRAAKLQLVVTVEVSVEIADDSVPEPDIVVCELNAELRLLPVRLVCIAVEVSWSTLADDLGWKLRAYAQAGIPEYWVVDLGKREVLVFALGADGTYADPLPTPFGAPLAARTIAGLTVDTTELARVPGA